MSKNPVSKTLLAVALAVVSTAASAQVGEIPARTTVVPRDAPGVLTRQPNAVGGEDAVTYSPTGRAEDTMSNNSAAAGNANQPSRVAPQGGAGGK